MSICKKRILSLFLFCAFTLISTVGFYFNKQQEAYAFNPLELTKEFFYYISSSLAVANGVVLETKNDIVNLGTGMYNDFLGATDEVKSTMVDFSNGFLKLTSSGLSWMGDFFSRFKNSTNISSSDDYVGIDKMYTVKLEGEGSKIYFSKPTNLFRAGDSVGPTDYDMLSLYIAKHPTGGLAVFGERYKADGSIYSKLVQSLYAYENGKFSCSASGGVPVISPSDLLKNYSTLDPVKSSQVAIPYNPTDNTYLNANIDDFVNSDWDTIKDKYTVSDTGTDTGTGTDPSFIQSVLEFFKSAMKFFESVLDWLANFFKNLWDMFVNLLKYLFYPEKSIELWEQLKSTVYNKFGILQQLKPSWSTDNNTKFIHSYNYKGVDGYIQLPDFFEENFSTIRNLFKYFVYGISLFAFIKIVRPRLTIGTR